jgi:hypothetical protein
MCCSASANVIAVTARAALVKSLLHQGLLDAWREGDSVRCNVRTLKSIGNKENQNDEEVEAAVCCVISHGHGSS